MLRIWQKVFIGVFGAIDRWEKKPGTRFRHWLRRVAKNSILSEISRASKDSPVGGSEIKELISQQPAGASDVQQELKVEYTREQYLRAAISVQSNVNLETWRAFELTVIKGKSIENTAECIGKSIGTVYAVRSRVMRRLQDHIKYLAQVES